MYKRTALALIISSATLLQTGCGQQESAAEYITQAKTSLASSQNNASIIALKNAIKVEPTNGEARFLLGQLYLSQGNGLNAVKELEKARGAKYDANQTLPLLARAYLLAEDYVAISDLNDKELTNDAKLAVKFFKTLAQLRQSHNKQAAEVLTQMREINGGHGYTVLADAFNQLAEQRIEQAQKLASQGLTLIPEQPETVLLLGNIAAINEDFPLAAEQFKQYLTLQPQQRSAELLLANVLLKAERFDEAEQHADIILAVLPNQPLANYIKAMVRIQAADYEAANRHAELAINNNFNQANIRLVAGVSAFYLSKHEQVLLYLEPLVQYLPEDHFARKMLVVSQLELGVIDNVTETLGDGENSSEQSDFYSALSYKLLKAGAKDEAKKLISTVNVDESSAQQLLKDGMLKMMLNDDKALASLEKAVALDPELAKAELAIAYIAVNDGDYAKAQAIADKWQTKYPEKADGLNLSAAIALKQGQYQQAKALLEQSVALEQNVYALMQLAQIAMVTGDKPQAMALINQAKAQAPDNLKVTRAYLQLDETGKALSEVEQKVAKEPDNQAIKLIYAEALMNKSQVDAALNLLNGITPDNKTPKFYWQLKINAYRANNNINLLQTTLNDWRKINPYHVEPYIYLSEVYSLKKDFDNALRTINSGLEKHNDHLMLKIIKTETLINMRDVVGAKAMLTSIAPEIQNLPGRHALYGRLALLENDYALAESHLRPLYQVKPSARTVMLLAASLMKQQKASDAIALLSDFNLKNGYYSDVNSLLGSLYLEQGDQAQALSTYQYMVEQQPNNVVAINNAAWLNMEAGQINQAKTLAEQAIALTPEQPSVLDTYAKILLLAGDARTALVNAKKAYELSSGKDIDVALNYAEILLANQRKNEASKVIEAIQSPRPEQQQKINELAQKL
ncbi:XrtA/PEP-CTERM system TPR-repeat protein PrsT [Colwellia sp. MEBiC06753]